MVASFAYFQEALDYREYAQRKGCAAVVRGRDLLYMWTRHWLSAYLQNDPVMRAEHVG